MTNYTCPDDFKLLREFYENPESFEKVHIPKEQVTEDLKSKIPGVYDNTDIIVAVKNDVVVLVSDGTSSFTTLSKKGLVEYNSVKRHELFTIDHTAVGNAITKFLEITSWNE